MDLFNSRDLQCILSNPIGHVNEDDHLYWTLENNGEYSIKSAYKMIQILKGSWQVSDNSSIWKCLWRIRAPSKVLNMV